MKKVGIQGIRGSFHDIAAKDLIVADYDTIECETFSLLIEKVVSREADVAIMAIENSLAGSILKNYMLIYESGLEIVGETYLYIKQNLVALPGQNIRDIHEVHSHPMAIMQCDVFLHQHPHIKIVEASDTALVAKEIQDHQRMHIAGITSEKAAEIYGLHILAPSIESHYLNYTRFLKLSAQRNTGDFDKATLSFTVKHKVGSLLQALRVFQDYKINMTKIQSTPLVGAPFSYQFFVDCLIHKSEDFKVMVEDLRLVTSTLRVLGTYKQASYEY